MKNKVEILTELQAGRISIEEATRLLGSLPQEPPDLKRQRAVGKLFERLNALEEIEIVARAYSITPQVIAFLDGVGFLSAASPFLAAGVKLHADAPGDFKNEAGDKVFTTFQPAPPYGVKLQLGKTAQMAWGGGLLGGSKLDVYVDFELRLVPQPALDNHFESVPAIPPA